MAVTNQHHLHTEGAFLPVLAGCWDLRLGAHPSLASKLPFLSQVSLLPEPSVLALVRDLDLPLMPATHGHHVVRDSGYLTTAIPPGGTAEAVDEYPLAPVFVRDLCGRTIHTGLSPLPAPPSVPIFPSGCRHVPAEHPMAAYIENALFLTWRRIEVAPPHPQGPILAGQPELPLRAAVSRPHTYACKLRPDTFYADGWRLPQVPRVFAQPADPVVAQAAAAEFLFRWQARPSGQDYETFYEANNGEVWFEELFNRGCTIIPTLEAYNGFYHVAEDYTATAVDPGRAVPGLHEVVRKEPSDLPAGTILAVEEPGWVGATILHQAKVVVSDGSLHPASATPQPLLPNLAFPHGRIGGTWGDVWLPTHPGHFAEPALWDWDMHGHFIQIGGPLWDPLHYIYTCTPTLTRATRKPLSEMSCLYTLPETLKARFHPLAAPTGYETLNERTAQQRREDPDNILYGSAIDTIPLATTITTLGYHPLPWALEYELDPAHFPVRNPRHHGQPCPEAFIHRLAPFAALTEDPATYLKYQVAVSEAQRAVLKDAVESSLDDRACHEKGTLLPQQSSRTIPGWLPEIPHSQLAVNVKRLFAPRAYRQALQQAGTALENPQLPAQFFQFREAALAWRRLRYRLFGKYPATWQQACAEGLDLPTAELLTMARSAEEHEAVREARKTLLGVVAPPENMPQGASSKVPASVAGGLPSAPSPVTLKTGKRHTPGRGRIQGGKSAPAKRNEQPETETA